jgi:hypothetical protein
LKLFKSTYNWQEFPHYLEDFRHESRMEREAYPILLMGEHI